MSQFAWETAQHADRPARHGRRSGQHKAGDELGRDAISSMATWPPSDHPNTMARATPSSSSTSPAPRPGLRSYRSRRVERIAGLAMSGKVDGDNAVNVGERTRELPREDPPRAARTMQQHDRQRPAGRLAEPDRGMACEDGLFDGWHLGRASGVRPNHPTKPCTGGVRRWLTEFYRAQPVLAMVARPRLPCPSGNSLPVMVPMQLVLDLVISAVSVLVIASYSLVASRPLRFIENAGRRKSISRRSCRDLRILPLSCLEPAPIGRLASSRGRIQLAGAALFWAAISASRKARLRFAFDPEIRTASSPAVRIGISGTPSTPPISCSGRAGRSPLVGLDDPASRDFRGDLRHGRTRRGEEILGHRAGRRRRRLQDARRLLLAEIGG